MTATLAPRGACDIRLKECRDWVNGLGSQPTQICQLVDLCRLAGKDGRGPSAAGFWVSADARLPILHASYPLVPWRLWPSLAFPVGAWVQQRRVNVIWEYGWTHVLGTRIRNHHIIYCRTVGKNKHYDGRALKANLGLHHPLLHGSVHTPYNNRWGTPPV